MNTLLWWFTLVLVLAVCAYHREPLKRTTLYAALWLLCTQFFGQFSWLEWLIFGLIAFPLNIPNLRQSLLTQRLFTAYKKIMPVMSSTEREAIEAGTTWWEADLFQGKPDWHKLHAFPAPQLTSQEQAFLDGPTEELCKMINDFEITHELADLPEELWSYLKERGFFAMIIKKKYGGLEFSAYAQSCVLQKVASISSVVASTIGVPNSLGPGELLQHYGTQEQKEHYLPRLASGQEIPCFALTSPEAGSDAGAIPDTGVVCSGMWKDQEVLGIRLSWNKRYITLAPVATVLGLAFKLYDPDHLLGDQEEVGITCALIPTELDGIRIGRRHFPLNLPFQNGPTQGKDVFVPLNAIIGGPEMAGQGWRMLVECLSIGRGITLPSNSTGGSKMAAMASSAYARIRRQFKLPIGQMQGIEEPLANICSSCYLMDAASTLTTTAIDLGEKPSVISAIVKYHLTSRGQKTIIDAMDIHGGKAICMGPSNYLARSYQGSPIAITVEGANILTRSMIIFGQGAIRCHPFVLEELKAGQHEEFSEGLQLFDQALFRHIGFALSNACRSLWFGLGGASISNSPYTDETERYYQALNRFSANLAFLSDIAMLTLGGALKRKESTSARLGDMLSELYLSSAVLKRYRDEGAHQEDLPLVQWALEDSLARLESALVDLLNNFPVPAIGTLLKRLVMPFGRRYLKPSDERSHQVAQLMMQPGESRNRVGRVSFLTPTDNNPVGKLQVTLLDILAAEPLVKRVSDATQQQIPFMWLDQIAEQGIELGVLNELEAELLKRAEKGRIAAISVDDFEPKALATKPSSNTEQRTEPLIKAQC